MSPETTTLELSAGASVLVLLFAVVGVVHVATLVWKLVTG